jgi:hypothetical protein
MLIAYSLPDDWTYTISTSFLTSDVELLHDFAPAEKVRFTWDDTDPQSTGNTVILSGTRATAFVPRGGCILGATLPAGLKVEIMGKRALDAGFSYALGGNSLTQKTVKFADGSIGLFWVFDDGLDPIVAYQVTFYNDVAGSPSIEPEAAVDIGQIVVAPMLNIPHELKWSWRRNTTSLTSRTLGAQVQFVPRTGYRVGKMKAKIQGIEEARSGGLANGMDWEQFLARLAESPFSIVVPRWGDIADAQRTAAFGLVDSLPSVAQAVGDFYEMSDLSFEEIPAGLN